MGKRVFSFSFWTLLLLTASIAIGARLYLVGSYRIVTDDFAPQLLKGDWVLVPRWKMLRKSPLEFRPLENGDLVVFHAGERRKRVGLVRHSGEGGELMVLVDGEVRKISITEIEGRVWKIWFSVGSDERGSRFVRWDRVLRGIN